MTIEEFDAALQALIAEAQKAGLSYDGIEMVMYTAVDALDPGQPPVSE